jgi:cellulose synthase/poly-beta-1,6-N-acetylglucosamine synthase-like glycosyltransferase
LDHVLRQDLDPSSFELVVVDDGSTDSTEQIVQDFAEIAPFSVNYLRHDNRGPGITLNRGIRAARGGLVLLLADDIFLMPNGLTAHLRWHEAHSNPHVAVLGKAVPSPELASTSFLSSWDAFGLERFGHLEKLPFIMFWVFAVSFKREFMLAHGMFREEVKPFTVTGHDDTELGYKLHQHGMILLYAKDALCYHHHPTTVIEAVERYRERGLHFPGLMAHAPDPRLAVFFRVIAPGTLGAYRRALRGCDWLRGRECSFAWHLFRHLGRQLIFNRWTVPLIWRPLLLRADKGRVIVPGVAARLFGPYLFYHFLVGIREARGDYRRV